MKRGIFLFLISLILFSNADAQVTVVRGPYLQLQTSTGIYIKWRTNTATESRVIYGTSPSALNQTSSGNTLTTDHEIHLTGLQPNTTYYYSVCNAANILSAGATQYFTTASPIGSHRPYSFWVIGDCGSKNADQQAVRNAFQNYMVGKPHVDGMIMLGDNAYDFGLDGEYQDAIFNNMYEDIVDNTVMWPCPGNHDYYGGADASTQSGAYYDIFKLPVAAQVGGYPSGTEAYYSYNIGNVHFISLDSYDSGRDSTNGMGNWLKLDLQQNTQEWTIVYWHHAPYTKGSHDSDNPFPWLDGELPEMREQFLPILERYGVDVVLCGHSHSYERSYLLDGHYGNSGSLTQNMILDHGSGDFTTGCPYIKKTQTSRSHKGTVYTLCGVSGKTSGTASGWPHPVMETATVDYKGSMYITVDRNRLDAKFITSTNQVYDSYTILKNPGGKQVITVCKNDTVFLSPSFPASQYQWFPGNSNQLSLPVSPAFNTYYYGQDPMGCVKDTFQVIVVQPGTTNPDTCATLVSGLNTEENHLVTMYPNPVRVLNELILDLTSMPATLCTLQLFDLSGREISTVKVTGGSLYSGTLFKTTLVAGTYSIRIVQSSNIISRQFIITN